MDEKRFEELRDAGRGRNRFMVALFLLFVVGAVAVLLESDGGTRAPRSDTRREGARPQPVAGGRAAPVEPSALPSVMTPEQSVRVLEPRRAPLAEVSGVVLRGATPVAGARVVAVSRGWLSPTEELASDPSPGSESVYVARTNERGEFKFEGIRGQMFRMGASTPTCYGAYAMPLPAPISGVTIRVQEFVYERLAFVDVQGRPIDVRGLTPEAGALPGTLMGGVGEWPTHARHRVFGAATGISLALAPNELAYFAPAPASSVQSREIRMPGFLKAEIAHDPSPLSDWPGSQTLTLARDASASAGDSIRYRVEFREEGLPSDWIADGYYAPMSFSLGVKNDAGGLRLKDVNRTHPYVSFPPGREVFCSRFDAPSDAAFRLGCDVIHAAGVATLVPRVGKLAFLDLFFGPPSAAHPGLQPIARIVGGASDLTGDFVPAFVSSFYVYGWMPENGHLRAGPMLPGTYEVEVRWPPLNGEGESVDAETRRFELRLESGANVMRWPESASRGARVGGSD